MGPSWLSCIQWNLSKEDTIGTQLAVLYREVALLQRWICTQLYVVGTANSVLLKEVSFIERFHCTKKIHCTTLRAKDHVSSKEKTSICSTCVQQAQFGTIFFASLHLEQYISFVLQEQPEKPHLHSIPTYAHKYLQVKPYTSHVRM